MLKKRENSAEVSSGRKKRIYKLMHSI